MSTATAVVTGITGQDGSYLAELLLQEGVAVHGVVRPGVRGVVRAGARIHAQTGVTMHEAELTTVGPLAAVIDAVEPDMVFHLAGMSSVAASWDDPVNATEVNALSTAVVLDACLRTQDRTGDQIAVVNASSCEIFAGSADTPQTESTPVRPISPYGASKALGHNLCQVYRARGLQASNAILYHHESPRRPERFVTRKITKAVARIAAGTQDSLTLGDLSVRRDWGWAPDYVAAMYGMALHGRGEDFVVATGEAHSISDFVATAFAAAGISDWQQLVISDDSLIRPADRPDMVGDATKAWDLLGWKATKSFHDIVVAMVDSDLKQELDA
jgi:GDPmannose 4,6-dehydratase